MEYSLRSSYRGNAAECGARVYIVPPLEDKALEAVAAGAQVLARKDPKISRKVRAQGRNEEDLSIIEIHDLHSNCPDLRQGGHMDRVRITAVRLVVRSMNARQMVTRIRDRY